MSHQHSIRNLLNLKDENIFFPEEFSSEEVVKGVKCKVIHATLTYEPEACYVCGHVFDSNIIKHGFKTSMIKNLSISGFVSYLKLKKQRYFCRHCHSTFTLKTDIVERNCFISNATKLSIALLAKEKISEKDIAKQHHVSHSTVHRIIDSFYENHRPNFDYLPPHLCFDEFKSVKSAAGAMSFIFCDSDSGTIVDIVEDRRLHVLKDYFLQYSRQARNAVKTIVIDMYEPYISLIKDLFPNADIILDKFHLVQLFNRAFNNTRINVMKEESSHSKKFKKYWKLLLKEHSKVDKTTYHYHPSFRKQMREIDIINYLLDVDSDLKVAYELYHTVQYSLKHKNLSLLQHSLEENKATDSRYMKTAIKTFKKHMKYIENTMKYSYTNGVLEGINNKIKVIKRVAFGYKCFYHFKNRILICQNLLPIKTA